MKKIILVFFGVFAALLSFSSCTIIPDNDENNNAFVPTLEIDDTTYNQNNDIPSLEIYSFSCIDDFKLFCTTESRDISLYKNGPDYGVFPPFSMKNGSYLKLDSLFPTLDMSKILFDHIEIPNDHQYSYSGKTISEETPVYIEVTFDERTTYRTLDSIIEDHLRIIQNSIKENENVRYEVFYGDYYDERTPRPSNMILVHNYYYYDTDGCAYMYDLYRGNMCGITIWCGNYKIVIGMGSPNNDAFFADETLTPISNLFKSEDKRSETLQGIADSIYSVTGQTPQAVIEPAEKREARVIFSNVPDAPETSAGTEAFETDLPIS